MPVTPLPFLVETMHEMCQTLTHSDEMLNLARACVLWDQALCTYCPYHVPLSVYILPLSVYILPLSHSFAGYLHIQQIVSGTIYNSILLSIHCLEQLPGPATRLLSTLLSELA